MGRGKQALRRLTVLLTPSLHQGLFAGALAPARCFGSWAADRHRQRPSAVSPCQASARFLPTEIVSYHKAHPDFFSTFRFYVQNTGAVNCT